MKKLILIITIIFLNFETIKADIPYFIDFKYILNQSVAGKKAQDQLKNKLNTGIEGIKNYSTKKNYISRGI